jgi:hypothetical protein
VSFLSEWHGWEPLCVLARHENVLAFAQMVSYSCHSPWASWPHVRPNPSIERTPYGMLRMPAVAAHVER